jgi:hypothetical protein
MSAFGVRADIIQGKADIKKMSANDPKRTGMALYGQAHNTKLETQKKYETVAAAALSIAIARW